MMQPHRYDVALSFAGEDRNRAAELYEALKAKGLRVFYDQNELADLWGKNLAEYLADLYSNRAKFCVMFISAHYIEKMWTHHERQAAQARAIRDRKEYILPIRLDDADVPGLLHTIGYLSWPPETAQTISDKIIFKLRDGKADVSHQSLTDGIPVAVEKKEVKLAFQRDQETLVEIGQKKAVRLERLRKILGGLLLGFGALIILAGIAKEADMVLGLLVVFAVFAVIRLPFRRQFSLIEGIFPYTDVTRMGKYLGNGQFAQLTESGKYARYKMSMKCDYPDCDGTVYITEPPSEARKYFTACCSRDKFVHRYQVKSNGIATREPAT